MTEKVVIAGDWHGDHHAAVNAIRDTAEAGIDTIYHVGDFGIGPWGPWYAGPEPWVDYYANMVTLTAAQEGVTVYVTPGNHDNHDTVNALPTRKDGWLTLTDRIFVAPRPHRWTHGGRTFASLSGAFSVDYQHLREGVDWWADEEPTMVDAATLGDGHADILITHDVPHGVPVRSKFHLPDLVELRAHMVRDAVTEAVRRTTPDVMFAGHWHQRITADVTINGRDVRVEVLSEEHTAGNLVTVTLDDLTVAPLRHRPSRWGSPDTAATTRQTRC